MKKSMNTTTHTTLLDILTKPVTGDVGVLGDSKTLAIESPIIHKKTSRTGIGKQEKTTEDIKDISPEDIREGERIYHEALAYIKDAIAPAMVKISPQNIQVNDTFCKTLFTYAYPDFLEGNWLSPLINWDSKFDVSMFIYPTDAQKVMKYLRRRLTELQSEKYLNQERGLTVNPYTDAQLQDVEELRTLLTRGSEKYFHFSIYITLYADNTDKLTKLTNDIQNMLHGRNILTKTALLRAEQGFTATAPLCRDEVSVYRNISTRGLSTTFPFTSATLSQDDGVLYGINTHNNSLIIYDRFRTENANMVVLAKS
jgi:conjugal transfer ATP-binding protein TraC